MLRVRSLRRGATGDAISLPAAEALPISASQSFRLRVPITPVVLLFLCGLVAARVFPDTSLISSEAGLGPGFVLPQIQQPQLAFPEASPGGTNLTGLQLRCQSFCLTRDAYVTRDEVSHCQSQCLAHPEVMDWMRALEASAAAPACVNPDRQLIFAAWYAEGDRGSEVRSASAMHVSSLLQPQALQLKHSAFTCLASLHTRSHYRLSGGAVHLRVQHMCMPSAVICFTPRTVHRTELHLRSVLQLGQLAASSYWYLPCRHIYRSFSAQPAIEKACSSSAGRLHAVCKGQEHAGRGCLTAGRACAKAAAMLCTHLLDWRLGAAGP